MKLVVGSPKAVNARHSAHDARAHLLGFVAKNGKSKRPFSVAHKHLEPLAQEDAGKMLSHNPVGKTVHSDNHDCLSLLSCEKAKAPFWGERSLFEFSNWDCFYFFFKMLK